MRHILREVPPLCWQSDSKAQRGWGEAWQSATMAGRVVEAKKATSASR